MNGARLASALRLPNTHASHSYNANVLSKYK